MHTFAYILVVRNVDGILVALTTNPMSPNLYFILGDALQLLRPVNKSHLLLYFLSDNNNNIGNIIITYIFITMIIIIVVIIALNTKKHKRQQI